MRVAALALRCEFDYGLSFAAVDVYGPLKRAHFGCVEALTLVEMWIRAVRCVKFTRLVGDVHEGVT